MLKGKLSVLLGARFQNPKGTAYSLHKGILETGPDDLVAIDDGPDFVFLDDISLLHSHASSTKRALEQLLEQYPDSYEATLEV